jgi:metal-sulfur cluster biosynthetic enzyme
MNACFFVQEALLNMNGKPVVTREEIIEVLKTIEDPELFLDIWFIGLIYRIEILEDGIVEIDMTFTSPMCPAGPELSSAVQQKVSELPGVKEVKLKIVFTPPWEASDEVKGLLGMI